jgi:uncharacterized delta-60 repeat protein
MHIRNHHQTSRRCLPTRLASILASIWVALFVSLALLPVPPASADDGDLDKSFGTNGVVLADFMPPSQAENFGQTLAVQRDGKILAGAVVYVGIDAIPNGALARYNRDGSLDASFGSGGKLFLSTVPEIGALAIQPDGKIIGGSRGLLRLNRDGTLDQGFGTGGKVDTGRVTALALALQSDGKILAGGRMDNQPGTPPKTTFALLRLMPDGTPDQDFGAGGIATADFNGMFSVVESLAITKMSARRRETDKFVGY